MIKLEILIYNIVALSLLYIWKNLRINKKSRERKHRNLPKIKNQ